MRVRRLGAYACGLATAAALELPACGLPQNGEAPEGQDASLADVAKDVMPPDAQQDTLVIDVVSGDSFAEDADAKDAVAEDAVGDAIETGVPEASPTDCGAGLACGRGCVPPGSSPCDTCDAGHIACNGTQACVDDCANCPSGPVTCCSQGVPSGACLTIYQIQVDYDGGCPMPQTRCPCPNDDAGTCPSSLQVCEQGNCTTCGENLGSGGLACHGPGICDLEAGTCH